MEKNRGLNPTTGADCYVDEGVYDSFYSYNGVQGLGHKLINCSAGCNQGLCSNTSGGWSSFMGGQLPPAMSSPQSLNIIQNQLASIANAVSQLIEKLKELNK